MIVKILGKSASFKGVSYNTNKMEQDKGELLKVSGFGALQALDNLRPQDYINYLEALSAQSSRIRYPQFHAVISCKGRANTKEELAIIADAWLKGMGYGDNPYMLIFHKDTKNNHIHLVSTRIGKNGKKINDSFEKLKSYEVLNRVLEDDVNLKANKDLEKALSYKFSTRPQFMMVLEAQGYAVVHSEKRYKICKFGTELASVGQDTVDQKIAAYQKNDKRISQIRAWIEKYKVQHDPAVYPKMQSLAGNFKQEKTGLTSKLAEHLAETFGLQVLYHNKDDKPVYGFTIIDHANNTVYKGSEIIDLGEFIKPMEKAQLLNDSHLSQVIGTAVFTADVSNDNQLKKETTERSTDQGQPLQPVSLIKLDIANDIDDEAIHGRNRQRKRKARTNSR